jgi:hypothetical protein
MNESSRSEARNDPVSWAGDLVPAYNQESGFYFFNDKNILTQFSITTQPGDIPAAELISKLNLQAGIRYRISDSPINDPSYWHDTDLRHLRVVGKDANGNHILAGIFEIPDERVRDLRLLSLDGKREGIDFYLDLHYGNDGSSLKKTGPDYTHVHMKLRFPDSSEEKEILSAKDKVDFLELLYLLHRHRIIARDFPVGFSYWENAPGPLAISDLSREKFEKAIDRLGQLLDLEAISNPHDSKRARELFQFLYDGQEKYHRAEIISGLQSGEEKHLRWIRNDLWIAAKKSVFGYKEFFRVLKRYAVLAQQGLLLPAHIEKLKSLEPDKEDDPSNPYPSFWLEAPLWIVELDAYLAQGRFEDFLASFEASRWRDERFASGFTGFLVWYLFRHYGLKTSNNRDAPMTDPWPELFPSKKTIIEQYDSFLSPFLDLDTLEKIFKLYPLDILFSRERGDWYSFKFGRATTVVSEVSNP